MNKDKVYVVYFDGKMLDSVGRKTVYLKEGRAKAVVTSEAKSLAKTMYREENCRCYLSELDKEGQKEWINKARDRFEIKVFMEVR